MSSTPGSCPPRGTHLEQQELIPETRRLPVVLRAADCGRGCAVMRCALRDLANRVRGTGARPGPRSGFSSTSPRQLRKENALRTSAGGSHQQPSQRRTDRMSAGAALLCPAISSPRRSSCEGAKRTTETRFAAMLSNMRVRVVKYARCEVQCRNELLDSPCRRRRISLVEQL